MSMTRRGFFAGVLAATAVPTVARAMMAAGGKDPNLSVFLSDIHVAHAGIETKWGAQPDYQNPLFEKAIDEILAMRPLPARVVGYIHGHNHRWRKNWYHDGGYSRRAVKCSVCLPSTGWWGDIGYAEMRTFADRAELQLVENDFFFPKPLGKGESRPREWDEIVAENRASAHMTFPF